MKPDHDIFGLSGKMLDGKYDVGAVIARGGFGVVYKGRHKALNKLVAIKVLSVPGGDAGGESAAAFLEAFGREAQIVAKLDHPAVVKVLDFGSMARPDARKVPWMAMDWVEGETLSKHLARRRGHGGRSAGDCLALMRPVLEALDEAHSLGIAHRDLKPANLMVVDPGILAGKHRPTRRGSPPLRLLDFGIAKVMSPDEKAGTGETWTQRNVGGLSPHYAAPEQFARTRTGPWTDVHAVGLILSEMLSDEAPYGGRKDEELLQLVFSSDRPTPSRLGVDAGPWEPVIAKALSIKPVDRFQTAGEFLIALESTLASEQTTPWRKPALAPAAILAPRTHADEEPIELSEADSADDSVAPEVSSEPSLGTNPSTLTGSQITSASHPMVPRPARPVAPVLALCAAAAGIFALSFVVASTPPSVAPSPVVLQARPSAPPSLPAPVAIAPVTVAPVPVAPVPVAVAPVVQPLGAPEAPNLEIPAVLPTQRAQAPGAASPRVVAAARPTTARTTERRPPRPARRHRPEEDHVPTE